MEMAIVSPILPAKCSDPLYRNGIVRIAEHVPRHASCIEATAKQMYHKSCLKLHPPM